MQIIFFRSIFKLGRLKTGTPPRIKKNSVNFDILEINEGDDPPVPFSFLNEKVWLEHETRDQLPCHITHTNDKVNQIILDNMHQNRHVTEEVTGPRYCPSVESKGRFFMNDSHNLVSVLFIVLILDTMLQKLRLP